MGLPCITTFAIFLLVPSISLLNAFELPNNNTFSQWNRMLELKLYDLVATATQVDFAKNVYKPNTGITIEKINGEDILKNVLKKLSNLLTSKKSALKKLVDKAEQKFEKFQKTSKTMLTLEDLSFFNMKAPKPVVEMTYSPRFYQPVSYEESGVHIPLEIFDGYSEILNGLNWTASLDEIFKENWRNDPNLRWQYFGSFFGFMRVYPAFRWPDHPSLPDLFDVRRRSWYIQGSVTPKDVIILIDRSGSVHGPTLDIMKITARALLNSLGENDYVNVAWFNNKVRWVIPCINTLVQATAQIRRLLGDAVERLTESNLTSYTTALDFAFEQFKKFEETKKPWAGSNCHKIVMFLSDGGTEWPTDLISRHCNESRNGQIKIFTFACGPHPIPTVVLKEMACSTGGYFSPVTALGSVRVKIRDYIKVLSRPLAYAKDDNLYQWHHFYRDIGGLGMVTTVTLPVFDKSHNPGNAVHLLGVMGIDIPVEEMTDLFPKYLLGSFGYSFAINTNGFVIFHPRLHDHIVYIEDPPNIYLTDLEGDDEKIMKMEKEIVEGVNGSLKNFQSIVPVGLGHAVLMKMDYFYGEVEPTTFRFGIAIPSEHAVAKVEIADVQDYLSDLSEMDGGLIAPWKFCSRGETTEDINIQKLVEEIGSNYTYCDKDLVNHLLWDAKKALKIKNHWNQSIYRGVKSRFLITSSGLTVTQTSNDNEEYKRQIDPLKNNLYKRASCTSGFVFSLSKEKRKRATVAQRITLNDTYVSAVIGADIEQEIIQEVFEEVVNYESNESCASPELLHCYLLNDGGIIAATNIQNFKPGDFIGLHDPELLENLISDGVLKREYRYNYQSWCSRDTEQVQAKASPQHFSILKFTYEAITAFHWNFFYTALLYFISGISAWKKADNAEHILDDGNHSCVTRSAWYYHSGISSHSGTFTCKSQTRSFRVSFMPNLMLLFLIAHPPCHDSGFFRPITLDADEDVELHYCKNQQHYRLRPGKCYLRIPKEVPSDCGAASESRTISVKTKDLLIYTVLALLLKEL